MMVTQPLMYGNNTFADCGIASIRFQRAMGHARVVVRVQLNPHPAYATLRPSDRPWEVRMGGWLALGHAQNHIVDLAPAILVWPHQSQHPRDQAEDLYACVSYRTLDLLHQQRLPGEAPLQFSVNLNTTTFGSAGTSIGCRHQLPYDLPISEWRRMLEECGYSKYVTMEVPLAGHALRPALKPVAQKLALALDHRTSGRWTDAVGACREVFDALEPLVGNAEALLGWSQFDPEATRKGMSLDQRLRGLRMVMRHATQLAHHNGTYSRDDATYIVDIACAALKYYNERLR